MRYFTRYLQYLIQITLWLTFLIGFDDASLIGGVNPASSFLTTIAPLVSALYKATDVLTSPLQSLGETFHLYSPATPATGFPYTPAPVLVAWFCSLFGNAFPLPKDIYPGVIDWWIVIASVLIYIGFRITDHFIDMYSGPVRNWAWNMAVEYLFQRRQVKVYERALDEKNADLAQMSTRYKSLAQETHYLKDSVITDELTQIHNKRFFISRMQTEFRVCQAERTYFSVIMVDIDLFKRLNDSYGHLSGDEVLKAVAGVLKRFAPDQCYPCRYGGEEFSMIMPRKTSDQALECAHLIQKNVQMLQFDNIDPKLSVTVSQGICTIDFAMADIAKIKNFDTVLELADQQMYRSKMEGRNRVSACNFTGANDR